MRMLYVEDDGDLRELVEIILASDPALSLTTAADGEAALDALSDAPFDAMIIDARLPGLSGPDVVRRLRGDPAHDRMAILFCTGRSDAAFQQTLLQIGADAVITKPAPLHELPQRARTCIADRRTAQAG